MSFSFISGFQRTQGQILAIRTKLALLVNILASSSLSLALLFVLLFCHVYIFYVKVCWTLSFGKGQVWTGSLYWQFYFNVFFVAMASLLLLCSSWSPFSHSNVGSIFLPFYSWKYFLQVTLIVSDGALMWPLVRGIWMPVPLTHTVLFVPGWKYSDANNKP